MRVSRLDKANKSVDMEHNASRSNNIPEANVANNIEKEAKVYESNLF